MPEQSSDEHRASHSTLNWLRAAVLGANDGIVSVSSIIVGVAGATDSRGAIFTAGLAGLVAGAMSMAVGEYVSVSSQHDAEKVYIAREKRRLRQDPEHELQGLTTVYRQKGLGPKTARRVALQLNRRGALRAHLDAELGLDEADLTSPLQAALASLGSFTAGALVPLGAMMLGSDHNRVALTVTAVVAALTITGYGSATVGGASRRRAIIRNVVGGVLAMLITYLVGRAFGASVS